MHLPGKLHIEKIESGSFFKAPTYRLEQSQLIQRSPEEIFAFFSDAFNLEKMTPTFLNFKILTAAPIPFEEGQLIDYQIRLYGFPMRWRTRLESIHDNEKFVDSQIRGPYAQWHHTHHFETDPKGTLMRDVVLYRVRFGLLGRIAHPLFVRKSLEKIFSHRYAVIQEVFPQD